MAEISLVALLREARIKKLRIFDFDDTLVKTDSFIYVSNKKTRKKLKLEPEEFAIYTPKKDDEFDFSEFDHSPLKNPKIIKRNFDLFEKMLKKSASHRKTVILTARANPKPIKDFLKSKGIQNVDVIAVGSPNPMKKANWIESQIKDNFTNIAFMDDSAKNIKAVKTLKKKYPNIELLTKLVKMK